MTGLRFLTVGQYELPAGAPSTSLFMYGAHPAACDAAALALEEKGFATLDLPITTQNAVAHSFAVASTAFDCLEDGPPALGPQTKDSANASGSHRVGALSNYNACREGFVFSNGASFCVHGIDEFEPSMASFFEAAARAAQAVLEAIERRLQLPCGWFDTSLGPIREHSQWHLKRYRQEAAPRHAVTSDGKLVLLAVHSDPSLISLVFHDVPGRSPGAMGLECQVGAQWEPVAAHGHAVVTILVGAVLDRLTCGHYRAVRHRVAVPSGSPLETARRVAATFFFRPAPNSVLQTPPSPLLPAYATTASPGAASTSSKGNAPRPIKFSAWQQKVADKYERHSAPRDFRRDRADAPRQVVMAPKLTVRVRAAHEQSAAVTAALEVRIAWASDLHGLKT